MLQRPIGPRAVVDQHHIRIGVVETCVRQAVEWGDERALLFYYHEWRRRLYASTTRDHLVKLLEENDIRSGIAGLDHGGISEPHSGRALDIVPAPVPVAGRRLFLCRAAAPPERGQQQKREQRPLTRSKKRRRT